MDFVPSMGMESECAGMAALYEATAWVDGDGSRKLSVMIWLIVLRFLLISLSNRGAHLIVSVNLI